MFRKNQISRRLFAASLILGTLCSLPTTAHATGETFSFSFFTVSSTGGVVDIFGEVTTDGSTDLSTLTVYFTDAVVGDTDCNTDGSFGHSDGGLPGPGTATLKDANGTVLATQTFVVN